MRDLYLLPKGARSRRSEPGSRGRIQLAGAQPMDQQTARPGNVPALIRMPSLCLVSSFEIAGDPQGQARLSVKALIPTVALARKPNDF